MKGLPEDRSDSSPEAVFHVPKLCLTERLAWHILNIAAGVISESSLSGKGVCQEAAAKAPQPSSPFSPFADRHFLAHFLRTARGSTPQMLPSDGPGRRMPDQCPYVGTAPVFRLPRLDGASPELRAHSADNPGILFGRDEALSHVVLLEMGKMWDALHPRRARLICEPVHAFQARHLSIDRGIAGVLLAAAVDVALELPGVELRCWDRAQEGFEVEAPTRLYIGQRTMFVDAVVAKQVAGQLFDPHAFGRVGLDLSHALAQEPGSLCGVSGPSRFSNRFTRLVVLDP